MVRRGSNRIPTPGLSRRYFLEATGAGVAALALGGGAGFLPRAAGAAQGSVRWVSPRGTIEVLDDYPYWVARKFGYFGAIETTLEPGPMAEIAPLRLVEQRQADVTFPPPRVFAVGLEQGIPLVSVWHMGAYDVFGFAFRKGEKVAKIADLAGKTILLGNAGWRAIVDPMLAQAGVDPKSVRYAEAGNRWGHALKQGQGNAALSWEGLRAQWTGQGLEFDYILPTEFSKFPANSFVIRRADFEDPAKDALYEGYLRGWAMGLEFGYRNPRATTHLVLQRFPALAASLAPAVATESMMQLANVFRGSWPHRQGWGWHDLEQWRLFFDTLLRIGQITKPIAPEDVLSNKYVGPANRFDVERVAADAQAYQLPPEFEAVDIVAIEARI
jgi:NitT/TauT family transport system substrate-binding protein